jgi:nucleoid DNA-binding protein
MVVTWFDKVVAPGQSMGRCLDRSPRRLIVVGRWLTLTTRHLKKGDKIRLTGLGILQVRKRAARMGRNPATGEAIKIKASKKIAFRPA